MVIAVGGEIDVYTAPKLRDGLVELINSGHYHLVIDLEGVDFLDSTGLGVLVGALEAGSVPPGHPASGLHPGAAAQDLPDHRTCQGFPDLRLRRGCDQPRPCDSFESGVQGPAERAEVARLRREFRRVSAVTTGS